MWSRVDDNIPHHPKFVLAGPIASWLWICGNCYANRYLTDGFIPSEILPTLGKVPNVRQHAATLVKVGLWELADGGYSVHDFHDHNPHAEDIRIKREHDRRRKTESTRNPRGIHAESKVIPEVPARAIPIPSQSHPNPIPSESLSDSLAAAQAKSLVETEIADRAAWLVNRYGELYAEKRHGARLRSRVALDWSEACDLCRIWPDNTHLEKLAILVLTTDDEWISKTDRSFRIFALKVSWADDRLKAWEREQGITA